MQQPVLSYLFADLAFSSWAPEVWIDEYHALINPYPPLNTDSFKVLKLDPSFC